MLLQCTVAAKEAGGLREWLPTAISAALKLRGTASHCSVAIFGGFHISIHDRVRRAYRRFAHRRDRWRHGPGCAWGGSATLWESPGAAPPVSLPLVSAQGYVSICYFVLSCSNQRWLKRRHYPGGAPGARRIYAFDGVSYAHVHYTYVSSWDDSLEVALHDASTVISGNASELR